MTPLDLREWQSQMGFTQAEAAKALGISQASYSDRIRGFSRTTGKPITIDRMTALACSALAIGLVEWKPMHSG